MCRAWSVELPIDGLSFTHETAVRLPVPPDPRPCRLPSRTGEMGRGAALTDGVAVGAYVAAAMTPTTNTMRIPAVNRWGMDQVGGTTGREGPSFGRRRGPPRTGACSTGLDRLRWVGHRDAEENGPEIDDQEGDEDAGPGMTKGRKTAPKATKAAYSG